MITTPRTLLLLVLLWFAPNPSAHAQVTRTQHGWWGGMGLGYGLATSYCDTCSGGIRLNGWTFSGELGWMASTHVLLGAGAEGWTNGLRRGRLPTTSTWTIFTCYYPRSRGGPFVQGGVGLSDYRVEHGTGDPLEPASHEDAFAAGTGRGYMLAVGWEGMPHDGGSGTIRIAYAHGRVGSLHDPGGATVATGWRQSVLLVEFGGRGWL